VGSLSNYYSAAVLNVVGGKATLTIPSTWVLLADGVISNGDTGTTISTNVEITAGGYARVLISASAWASATASGSLLETNVATTFPEPSASWGTVTYWAIADASVAGNVIAFGSVAVAKSISSGVPVRFNAGGIDIFLT